MTALEDFHIVLVSRRADNVLNAHQGPFNRPKGTAGRYLVFIFHRVPVKSVNRSAVINVLHDVGYDRWCKRFGKKAVEFIPRKALEHPFTQGGQLTVNEPYFAFPFLQQWPSIVSREVLCQTAEQMVRLEL